jgi:hypothetical protein
MKSLVMMTIACGPSLCVRIFVEVVNIPRIQVEFPSPSGLETASSDE